MGKKDFRLALSLWAVLGMAAVFTAARAAVFFLNREYFGALSGAGTLDLANNALTVRAPSASNFPRLSAKGATLDLGGKEATTHRLDGFMTVMNGVLVLDGDWTLAKAEVQDPNAVSAGIAFSSTSRFVLSEADQRQLSDAMPAGGYLLATGVTGCPRFSKAADAKIALFVRDGDLILGRNLGTMVIVR